MEAIAILPFWATMAATVSNHRGLGWAIRKVRRAQDRTLEDVAGAVGSDAGNLSRIERGAQNVPEPLVKAIATELGVTMSQLWAVAEEGAAATVEVLAKAGQMRPEQVRELNRFADYLLSQDTDS